MKREARIKTLPFLIIFVLKLVICTTVVSAELSNSTVLSTPEPTLITPIPVSTQGPIPPTPGPTDVSIIDNAASSKISGLASSTVLSISLANSDPNPAVAGDTVEIRVSIENMGGDTTTDMVMEIMPEYPFELVAGESAIKDIGTVEGYKADSTANIKIVKYRMKIDKDALAESYELKVKYYESGSKDKTTKSLYVDVKSIANVEIIHIDKTALIPGKQDRLKFTINNVGNAPLKEITFNWEDKNNIVLPVGSDNTRYIKYIDVNSSFDLEYQVIADTSASPGLYKLNLYLNYRDGTNGTMKQLSSIAGVYVGGGTDFDISFSESTDSETSFSVANIGSNPAYAVLITFPDQGNWKVSSSDSIMIGNLNAGDYTSASFKLQSLTNTTSQNATSQNGKQKVQMQISYTDTMGKRQVVDKEVKLGPQNVVAADSKAVDQKQQGGLGYMIIGIVVFLLIFGTYLKYRKKKLVNPEFKALDLFKGRKT